MKKKLNPVRKWTVVLVPDGAGASREVQLSSRVLKTILIGAGALGLIAVSGVFTAVTERIERSQLDRLRRQNQTLAAELATMQTRITHLGDTIGSITGFEDDIRLLAGLPATDPEIQQAGVGGPVEPLTAADQVLSGFGLGRAAMSSRENLDGLIRRARLLAASYREAVDTMEANRSMLERLPSIMPTTGFITSGFSQARMHPVFHRPMPHPGIDIPAPKGTPILAPAKGRVTKVEVQSGYGNLVTLDHGNGIVTRYAHCSEIIVRPGQTVERGQEIAKVGDTGVTTNYHLHYEVMVDGRWVDPRRFIFGDVIVD